MTSTAAALSAAEVEAIRAATPLSGDRIHLNHAGDSPSSATVLATQIDHLRRESEIGGYEAAVERAEEDAGVYRSIATMLGCQPEEIARQEHATAAWNAGFWSIPMQPGQRILTAEAAYGANAVGFLHAEQHRGVTVEVVPSDETGQVDVAALSDRVGDDVALIALTHIPTNGGLVNPAAEVGAVARAAGIPFLLDACQSVGHLDLDVTELGCDLLSATGRKYLRGPRGTGFLYASEAIVERLVPATPDHHGATWADGRTYTLASTATRFEHWEYNHAAWLALGTAVDEAMAIGIDRIEATIRARAAELRTALEAAGFPVLDLGVDRCGIVTTSVPGVTADVAKRHLAEAGINVSISTPDSTRWDAERRNLEPMLRLSVHASTLTAEAERAVTVLTTIPTTA